VTISDRKKDVIITGGGNVSSIEVDCISHLAEVAEVAVIGVPDEKTIIAHCKQRLAGFKAPTTVEFGVTRIQPCRSERRVGSNKFSRCSGRCRDSGGGAAPARLNQIITAPATINTTAMTNQIMLRPLPTATIPEPSSVAVQTALPDSCR
jgi:hypothetical protein